VVRFRFLCAILVALAATGCAGPVQQWIVNTRIHQGDAAVKRGNVRDAETSYRLALRVDPKNDRARAGFVNAAADLAQVEYEKGQFEDGLATLADAAKVDPQNVRVQGLRSTIEQAKLNREIVISNYPTYSLTGQQIQRSFESLDTQNKLVLKSLRRFDFTYDTQNLTKAIKQAYDLEDDMSKNLSRLIAYRQLVEAGIPASRAAAGAGSSSSSSLLPLP
jgi:tetratricopeptide (TPR) repeat protein